MILTLFCSKVTALPMRAGIKLKIIEMESFVEQLLKNKQTSVWKYDHSASAGHIAVALRLAEEVGLIEKK